MQIEALEKNKPTGKSVLLFSGGLDSLCMAYLLKPDVLLYIEHGQKYWRRENTSILELEKILDKRVKIDDMSLFLKEYERPDAIIPLRNLFFLAVAAQHGETIYIGAMSGDRTLDKSEDFLHKTKLMFDYLYQDQHWCEKRLFNIKAPYKSYTKTQLVAEYLKQGGSREALKLSYSCYEGREEPCWQCKACVRKAVALINNNIDVPGFDFKEVEWLQDGSSIRRAINKREWRGEEDLDFENAMIKTGFL